VSRIFYSLHKWISALAFVQLAIWTVSGFTFTWIRQESIRSAPVEGAHVAVLDRAPAVDVARAIEAATGAGPVERVELRGTPTGSFYVVKGRDATVRVDARSGEASPVLAAEAEAIARDDQPGHPPAKATTRIDASPPLEYRDCEPSECALPVYRVALDDAAGTAVYVDAVTGDVTARRNDAWRTYDFFWSLHIMDYRAREDFNHWLIRGAAILAMATVLSGTILLAIRTQRWIRRKLA
jgi:PepSY-associated TM region